jgi:CTP synthase
VQVVPHITDDIQKWIQRVALIPVDSEGRVPEVCIIELGGTVGDIESAPFIEAMRQFQFRVGVDNFFLIHVSLVPVVGSVGEQKTKPTQSSVRDLRGLGLSPDIIACRSRDPISKEVAAKLSMFCHVAPECVIAVHDCKSVYHVPLLLKQQGLLNIIQKKLKLEPKVTHDAQTLMIKWSTLALRQERLHDTVRIVLVGKYTQLHDAYISVVKSLEHAALSSNRQLILEWIEAEELELEMQKNEPVRYHESWKKLVNAEGILVTGGFGIRGTEGKILAIQYAREKNIPFLGICLGLQLAVIEFCRNVIGLPNSNSTEFDKDCLDPVVINMPEISDTILGGTMRLGSRETIFQDGSENSVTRKLYGNKQSIFERHRHRYEVNPAYVERIEAKGMKFIGKDSKGERMIILEISNNDFFVCTQFHPEYKTRPLHPCPVFLGFVLAASKLLKSHLKVFILFYGRIWMRMELVCR